MAYGTFAYGGAPYGGTALVEPDPNYTAPDITATAKGGVVLSYAGNLSVDVNVEAAPLTITTQDILVLKPKMRLPVFHEGKPLHPNAAMRVSAAATASGTAVDPPATPAAGETRVPTLTPHWQWLADDISSSLQGEYIDVWPGVGASPNITSYFPLRPKLTALSTAGTNPPRWNKVLAFATRFDEKMFLSVAAESQPFTWIGIGQLDGPTLDGFSLLNTDGQNKVISGQQVTHDGGDLLCRTLRYASFDAYDFNAGRAVRKRRSQAYRNEPFVYTMTFDGANSRFRRFSARGVEEFTGLDIGTNGFTDLIFGGGDRGYKVAFLVELRYYRSALTTAQMQKIEQYARTTYEFDRW